MNKNRIIFYVVFVLFQLTILLVSVFFNAKSQDELVNYFMQNFKALMNWISLSKYIGILGLVLLIIDIVWAYTVHKKTEFEKNALFNELTALKAKLFDLQEDAKKVSQPVIIQDKIK